MSRMAVVQRSIKINASPAATMTLLSDASLWPDWYPGMTSIDIVAPFPAIGGQVTFGVKSAGLTMAVTETVVDFQPDKLHLFEMEGMLRGRARWEVTPEREGTRLTTTFDYELPGGVIGKMANALVVKRLNATSLEGGLQNFKELVEGR
jgi:carbon monoxide dehydrogenase subunit G